MPKFPASRSLVLLAMAALASCSNDTQLTRSSPALTASAVEGSDGQSTVAGAALPLPLGVLVQEDGAPKQGVTVSWAAAAGTVSPASGLTDTRGIAAASWTLGSAPGFETATATVAGAEGSPVTFSAVALTRPGMVASIAGGNAQVGEVGTLLPVPLAVRVRTFGPTNAGVTVLWSTTDGHVTSSSSTTDAAGNATASWTLGTVARDSQTVIAQIIGAENSPLTFTAWARPGPAASITGGQLPDTAWAGPGYTTPFGPLCAIIADRYGNRLPNVPVSWSVVSGPIHVVNIGEPTDESGETCATVAPDGPAGPAVVQAALAGGNASTNYTLAVVPMEHFVAWDGTSLTSGANGTSPAVDTIAVGTAMSWRQLSRFAYGYSRIESVGAPSFPTLPFAPTATFTFVTPGTYQYQVLDEDGYPWSAIGTLVVQ